VAFAICAHADADLLIVDEALSVGDQLFQHKCEKYITDFSRNGTILMVSHDLPFIAKLCDRVLWLEKGVVREIGDPARIIADYEAAMQAEEDQAAGAA
jgi:lipopolysaccharide transport system ATP-binding protein